MKKKHKGPPVPVVGSINLATLMEFERKTPDTKVCTCNDFGSEFVDAGVVWMGGEHLVSVVPGTENADEGRVLSHYYPDPATRTVLILKFETVKPE